MWVNLQTINDPLYNSNRLVIVVLVVFDKYSSAVGDSEQSVWFSQMLIPESYDKYLKLMVTVNVVCLHL